MVLFHVGDREAEAVDVVVVTVEVVNVLVAVVVWSYALHAKVSSVFGVLFGLCSNRA